MKAQECSIKHADEKISDWIEFHPLARNLLSLAISTLFVTGSIVGFGSLVGRNVPTGSVAAAFVAGSFASRIIFGQIEAAIDRGKNG